MSRLISALVLTSVLLLSSCSPEEPLINSFNGKWRLLLSGPTGLYTISMPDQTVLNQTWKPTTDLGVYPVQQLRQYRNDIYVLTKSESITVLNRETLTAVAEISLSGYGHAADIAFANATTAYVSLPDSMAVGVIDLTVFQIVRTISVGDSTAGIAALGNQICVALPHQNKVAIIDSRTNTVEARLDIPSDVPSLVEGDPLNNVFCVVSLGKGKTPASQGEDPTVPSLSTINVSTRTITATVALTSRDSEGPLQIASSLSVNSSGYCYVPVQNGLLQIQTRTPRRAAAVQFESYTMCSYDAARALLMCTHHDEPRLTIFDEFAEKKLYDVAIPFTTNCRIIGLAP